MQSNVNVFGQVMKKKSLHFSVEDIIRSEFKKPLSRGTVGKDANGLLWAYGLVMKPASVLKLSRLT